MNTETSSSSTSVEAIWSAFEKASARLAFALQPKDLERLVRPTWFLMDHCISTAFPHSCLPAARPEIDAAIRLAAEVRDVLGQDDMSPLLQLPQLLERVLNVGVISIDHQVIAGSCAVAPQADLIYLSRDDHLNALYMCARQLGHLLLLRGRASGKMLVTIELSHETTHAPVGSHRRFADFFALELLVPSRGLGIALKEVRDLLRVKNPAIGDIELLYLARIFGISFLALARRCERAKLLPKGGANVLHSILIEKYGGPEKRAEILGLPARPPVSLPTLPRTALQSIRSLVKERPAFLREAASQLRMAEPRLRSLLETT